MICFSVFLLLGYSTQSKMSFGLNIQAISAQQQQLKEQKRVVEEKNSGRRNRFPIKEQLEASLKSSRYRKKCSWY